MGFVLDQDSLFSRQNFWLKVLILSTGFVTAIIVPMKALLVYLTGILLYSCLSPSELKPMAKGIKMLLPFLAAYGMMCLLFRIDFPVMATFIIRMLILTILLVHFWSSTSLHRFLEDASFLSSNPANNPFLFFCVATLLYLKQFILYYQTTYANSKISGNSITRLIPAFTDAIVQNWHNRQTIEEQTVQILSYNYIKPAFINKSNIMGCFFLTFLTLVLAL